MPNLRSFLGVSAACLALAGTALTPFILGPFSRGLASLPLHPADPFSGGEVAQTLARDGYRIRIHRPVRKEAPLQEVAPFLQLDWEPVNGLPARVEERLDLSGEGLGPVTIRFALPVEPKAAPSAELTWADGTRTLVRGEEKHLLSEFCLRTRERLILRVPLAPARTSPGF